MPWWADKATTVLLAAIGAGALLGLPTAGRTADRVIKRRLHLGPRRSSRFASLQGTALDDGDRAGRRATRSWPRTAAGSDRRT